MKISLFDTEITTIGIRFTLFSTKLYTLGEIYTISLSFFFSNLHHFFFLFLFFPLPHSFPLFPSTLLSPTSCHSPPPLPPPPSRWWRTTSRRSLSPPPPRTRPTPCGNSTSSTSPPPPPPPLRAPAHHSLGDGASLTSLLLAYTRRADDPSALPSLSPHPRPCPHHGRGRGLLGLLI
uniref:Uncharacterized protein n=1 Tax=Ananas comosus var. bracteatus TaxID=296719 RepID=A0A6V7QVW9_ANACO